MPSLSKLKNLEDENDDFIDDLNQPFNPKDIDITVETRSLDSIISRMKHEEIDLNTHFQRKGDLWASTIMSRLIESILIRFPLPAFYFDATDDDLWLIVDGLQRLSAIRKFVLNCDRDYVENYYTEEDKNKGLDKPLKLTGLEYLKECNGLTYEQLPVGMKRRINEAQITTYLVKPGTPEDVVYSVFYRINTGGLMLNAQEIRHALNQGRRSPKYVEELANTDTFKRVVRISDKRMQDRELALRYTAFKIHDFADYRPSMVRYLNGVMKELNKIGRSEFEIIKEDLDSSLNICHQLFGESVFSKSLASDDYKSTLNRALFETWTVMVSNLSQKEKKTLLAKREEVNTGFKRLLRNSDFDRSISISTTGYPQVQIRFSMIKQLIHSIIYD